MSGVFVKDNQGDEDETCLEYLSRTTKVMRMKRVWSILSFYGTPLDVTNMKDFNPW